MVNYPTRSTATYIELNNVINSDLNEITVGMWVKTSDPMKFTLLGYGAGSTNNQLDNEFQIACNSGNDLVIYIDSEVTSDGNNFCSTLRDDQWHYVSASYDTATDEYWLSLDGMFASGTFSTDHGIIEGGGRLLIGQDLDPTTTINANYPFSGTITGITIHNSKLSTTTINTMRQSCINSGNLFTWNVDPMMLVGGLSTTPSTCTASTGIVCALTGEQLNVLFDYILENDYRTSSLIYIIFNELKHILNDYLFRSRYY